MSIVQVSHLNLGRARVTQQFKDKPNFDALVVLLAQECDGLEQVFFDLMSFYATDTAGGAQLDVIGRIVGEPRNSETDDAVYRRRILARIRANKSSGTPEEIYAVFGALGIEDMELVLQPTAGFSLRIGETLTAAQAAQYSRFLGAARAAGVHGIFEWFQGSEATTMSCTCQTNTTAIASVGATAITVSSLVGFSASGQLALGGSAVDINGDPDDYDVYTYAQATGGQFKGLTPPIFLERASGSTVTQYPFPVGMGLGDSTTSETGGGLAGAVVGVA